MDRRIDFLIIGSQKSGTTSLYDWLGQHPNVFLPEAKEILYFAKDEFYLQGEKYLDVFYRRYRGQKIVGGAYVHLIYFSYAARRIYSYNPQMKIIAVLRNPVDRSYSAYWFARLNGWESEKTFEDALRMEEIRAYGTYKERAELTYLAHGRYAEQLKPYFDLFGSDRIMIVLTEDLKSRPSKVIKDILEFLGLSFNGDDFHLNKASNHAAKARFPKLQGVLESSHEAWYERWGRKLLPAIAREFIRTRFIKKMITWNSVAFRYPPMNIGTRKELLDYFKPHNELLEKSIGVDLSSWDQ